MKLCGLINMKKKDKNILRYVEPDVTYICFVELKTRNNMLNVRFLSGFNLSFYYVIL